ncbi:MFS transporter [Burkholderia multivorans]|uniref:MFS transporter n=1 Tax=Burkholderia multivorans TaxID=87883 RepID=UPI001C24ACDE|nr:MFS transporter [Burkholderia multivorans]MBU9480672.1 MHS family MFS transporter [Burkholderia multivorans]
METAVSTEGRATRSVGAREERLVILGSSLGTVFEWYDFYLYGSLAVFFGAMFFPTGNAAAALLASLATFGAGFAVRPLGALVFGRLGDLLGRKQTFLITIVLMGASTALVGILPTYEQIGVFAPILLVSLRLVQGLAMGGEYGGAAIYVAEHAPAGRRGARTSWIQTTGTIGFLLSLGLILACRATVGEAEFRSWGWRIPFLFSLLLLAVSVYIRLKLHESPVFLRMKAEQGLSKAPVKESFTDKRNVKIILIALFGAIAGQAVVWYTGQFYALFFLQSVLKVDFATATFLVSIALVIGTPLFVVFGYVSDSIGRKPIMLAGCLLGVLTFLPIYKGLTHYANPALEHAMAVAPVVVHAPADCGKRCETIRSDLTSRGIPHDTLTSAESELVVTVGAAQLRNPDSKVLVAAARSAGYPASADPAQINKPMVLLLLTVLMVYVAMVYGPMAAFLVELFPARIRYTSLSLPYHVGNGCFGGFLPLVSSWLVLTTGNLFSGLYYPIGVAALTFVIGILFVKETRGADITR